MKRDFAALGVVLSLFFASASRGGVFTFSTGNPDGKMATLVRPGATGVLETETGDDFILSSQTSINAATFTGILTGGATTADISQVVVEIYRVFPKDSQDPPSGKVPTRVNSPSDVAFDSRESSAGSLSFTTSVLSDNFAAGNSVVNEINPIPNQTTGGEGAVSGTEVQISVNLSDAFNLPPDHYFFVPQVAVNNGGNFLWLSAPKPIVSPGTPFSPDLQAWIRNENLAPDWLRIGTDVVGGTPAPTFNATFSLAGTTNEAIPLPPAAWSGMLTVFAIGFTNAKTLLRKRLSTV